MRLSDKGAARFKDVTDEELISRMREGEEGIEEYLLDKYKNLVRSKAKSMYILGADSEDLIQEGMIGLYKAIRDYDSGRDASFFTFADLCVSRQVYTAVSASGRQKHMPLNSYISLYSHEDNGDGENASLEDTLPNPIDTNPEALVIGRENVEKIENWIETELSEFERQALELYLTGMSYVSIAHVLGKEEKATDNALNRAKNKLRKLIEGGNKNGF